MHLDQGHRWPIIGAKLLAAASQGGTRRQKKKASVYHFLLLMFFAAIQNHMAYGQHFIGAKTLPPVQYAVTSEIDRPLAQNPTHSPRLAKSWHRGQR
jgi:hypothetical protein